MRFWPVLASLALASAALPSIARGTVNGSTVQIALKIPIDPDSSDVTSMDHLKYKAADNEIETGRYFNRARCRCDKAGKTQQYLADITWDMMPEPTPTSQLRVWTGGMCDDAAQRPTSCTELAPLDASFTQVVHRFERVGALMGPTNTDCSGSVSQATYGIYSTTTGNDLMPEATATFGIDLIAPAVPPTVKVVSLKKAIRLEWPSVGTSTDYAYFQALCSDIDGDAVHTTDLLEARFDTVAGTCALPADKVDALTISNPDDFPTADGQFPLDLLTLDKMYLCGEAVGGSATSIDLKKLENGVPYWVVLVAVDRSGNYTAGYVPKPIEPTEITDFWQYINEDDQNPAVQGGLCLIESAFGDDGGGSGGRYAPLRAWRDELGTGAAGRWLVERYYAWGEPVAAAARASLVVRIAAGLVLAPLIAVALAWHLLTLPGLLAVAAALILWRRRGRGRSRQRGLALAVTAAVLLAPAVAAAQSITPYWDDGQPATEARVEVPRWHMGLRAGVYLPSIDKRFTKAPYVTTFSEGKRVMPVLDLHRVLTTRFGQFGLGVSAGYFSQDAPSYLPIDPLNPTAPRTVSVANRSYVRMVPVELTAIYRVSQLDDAWAFPLVPYVRGGLGYYIWWMKGPDDVISKACDADGKNCDRALGASLGLVGAAGLSIRAERIDEEAARSMRDSGIEHSGFFAELSTAWVDGFGNEKKMSLGDTTWFAGVDFEF